MNAPRPASPPTDIKPLRLPAHFDSVLLRRVAALITVFGVFMGCWQLIDGRIATGTAIIILALLMGITFLRAGTARVTFGELNAVVALIAVLMLAIAILSGREAPAITILFPLLPFFFAAIGARRSAIIWLIITMFMLIAVYWHGRHAVLLYSEPPANFPLIYMALVFALTATISLTAFTLMGKRAEYLASLATVRDELELAVREETDANASKAHLLGRVGHELRTPLNAIIGFADLLARDHKAPLSAAQLQRIRYVQMSGQRLLELVDEILDVTRSDARASAMALQPVLPLSVVNDALAEVAEVARAKGVVIDTALPPHESTLVLADRRYLLDVLGQLLTNAIIYNRPDGRVRISMTSADTEIRLNIADTGIGINSWEIAELFEPLRQTRHNDESQAGSGLGLTIAKSLIEHMGGRIEVESVLGQGSTFTLVLPRYRPDRDARANGAS